MNKIKSLSAIHIKLRLIFSVNSLCSIGNKHHLMSLLSCWEMHLPLNVDCLSLKQSIMIILWSLQLMNDWIKNWMSQIEEYSQFGFTHDAIKYAPQEDNIHLHYWPTWQLCHGSFICFARRAWTLYLTGIETKEIIQLLPYLLFHAHTLHLLVMLHQIMIPT